MDTPNPYESPRSVEEQVDLLSPRERRWRVVLATLFAIPLAPVAFFAACTCAVVVIDTPGRFRFAIDYVPALSAWEREFLHSSLALPVAGMVGLFFVWLTRFAPRTPESPQHGLVWASFLLPASAVFILFFCGPLSGEVWAAMLIVGPLAGFVAAWETVAALRRFACGPTPARNT